MGSMVSMSKGGADPDQQFTLNNVKRGAIGLAEFKGLNEVEARLKAV